MSRVFVAHLPREKSQATYFEEHNGEQAGGRGVPILKKLEI